MLIVAHCKATLISKATQKKAGLNMAFTSGFQAPNQRLSVLAVKCLGSVLHSTCPQYFYTFFLFIIHLPKSNKIFFSRAIGVPTTATSVGSQKLFHISKLLGKKPFLCHYVLHQPPGQTQKRVHGLLPCWRNIDVGRDNFSFLLKETDRAGVFFVMVKDPVCSFGVCCFHIFLHGQREQGLMRHFFT